MCVTGLSIVDFSHFHLASQLVALLLIVIGGAVLLSIAPIIIRRYYYRRLYASNDFRLHQPTPFFGPMRHDKGKSAGDVTPRPAVAASIVSDTHRLARVEENLEYMALGELLWVIIGYYVFFNVVSIAILVVYFYTQPSLLDMWKERTKAGDWAPFYGAAFHCISAFNNAGFSPLADNLVYFQNDPLVLIVLSVLIAAGNTAYPMILRLFVCLRARWAGPQRAPVFRYLLDYPRR